MKTLILCFINGCIVTCMFMKLQEITFAGYLRFSGNRQEVSVDIEVKDDIVLERNETFTVTARPPADPKQSRDAIATITIIDNDGKLLIFLRIYTFIVNSVMC